MVVWIVPSAGARPAGARHVAHGGVLAGLRDLCLPAAGRGLKTRVLGSSWAGSSVVVLGATRVVLAGVFVCSVASSRRVCILNAY